MMDGAVERHCGAVTINAVEIINSCFASSITDTSHDGEMRIHPATRVYQQPNKH